MRLYHYTSWVHGFYIAKEGITRGECPVTKDLVLDFPNLTSDTNVGNQKWNAGGMLNKGALRFPVDIPDGDDKLISWRDLTTRHKMDKATYRHYDALGGYGAKNWWIYQGAIPKEWLSDVEILSRDHNSMEAFLCSQCQDFATYEELLLGNGFFKNSLGLWSVDTIAFNARVRKWKAG
ncbi:hypothetical protein TA3x_004248 [Tundrisphaera sp. TA3]|uniref:hypothetical protein n=1 Tax=Tundrisphaera sp. TA3 TaxID=3435775 RepID=UPI003EBDEDC5